MTLNLKLKKQLFYSCFTSPTIIIPPFLFSDMFDEDFWISQSKLTPKGAFDWTANKNIPKFSNWEPGNQCMLWYWMNVELCYALWPVTNELNYDHCDKRKYFICERTRGRYK